MLSITGVFSGCWRGVWTNIGRISVRNVPGKLEFIYVHDKTNIEIPLRLYRLSLLIL